MGPQELGESAGERVGWTLFSGQAFWRLARAEARWDISAKRQEGSIVQFHKCFWAFSWQGFY